MYHRLGFCLAKEDAVPWSMARHRFVFLCPLKADVPAMRHVIMSHDALFTLARNYPMNADHDIEYIYHQYLVANHAGNSSKAEMGIDGVRAVEQLLGCAHTIFRDRREMMPFLVGELRR